MPRTLWNGSLSFGLVNVPVRLTSAARDLDLHFRQLHEKDGSPIEQRRYCSEEGTEVEWEEVGRGFELEDGDQVVLTDEELATAQPRKTRTIEVEAFVDSEDVDPIYFAHPWSLLPAGDSEGTLRAYQLLVKVMESTGRAALGRFVMRTKEYLVLVRPRDEVLALTTLRFHDEVRPTDEIAPGGRKPAKKIEQAVAVIESLSTDWEPERYTDCYRERLVAVVEDKKNGKRVKAPEERKEPEARARPDGRAAGHARQARVGQARRPRALRADEPRGALRASPGRGGTRPLKDVEGRADRGACRLAGTVCASHAPALFTAWQRKTRARESEGPSRITREALRVLDGALVQRGIDVAARDDHHHRAVPSTHLVERGQRSGGRALHADAGRGVGAHGGGDLALGDLDERRGESDQLLDRERDRHPYGHPVREVAQRSHSTGRPAATLQAITGASFATTPMAPPPTPRATPIRSAPFPTGTTVRAGRSPKPLRRSRARSPRSR